MLSCCSDSEPLLNEPQMSFDGRGRDRVTQELRLLHHIVFCALYRNATVCKGIHGTGFTCQVCSKLPSTSPGALGRPLPLSLYLIRAGSSPGHTALTWATWICCLILSACKSEQLASSISWGLPSVGGKYLLAPGAHQTLPNLLACPLLCRLGLGCLYNAGLIALIL